MLGSSAFRMSVTPGGALAGPWVKNSLWSTARAVPSFDLPFADTKSLVDAVTGQSLVTFTRASSGTSVGSDGLIKTATTNLQTWSEDFRNTADAGATRPWTYNTSAVTADSTTAPNGTITADLVAGAAGSANKFLSNNVSTTTTGFYVFSVFLKQGTEQFVVVRLTDGAANGIRGRFDLSAGTVVVTNEGTATGQATSIAAVGNGWYRCVVSCSFSSLAFSVVQPQLWLNNFASTSLVTNYFAWGAQLEQSSTVGEYIPTTSTINSAPRFDHNPTTGESLGLLVEESRTNEIRNSNSMSAVVTGSPGTLPTNWSAQTNANGWTREIVGSGSLGSLNYVDIRFYGTPTSAQFTMVFQPQGTVSAANGQAWAASAYHQLVGGSLGNVVGYPAANLWNSTLAYLGGLGLPGSIVPSATLQRYTGSATISTAGTAFINWGITFVCTAGNTYDFTIRFAGPQLELGAFSTSFIPTTGAAATRSADVASITGSNFGTTRTNLLVRSEEFDNASWTKQSSVSVSANTVIAPSGTLTADTVTADVGLGIFQTITSVIGVNYSNSIYVKAGTATSIMFRDDTGAGRHIVFNPSTGVITSTSGTLVSFGSQAVGDGWYRYWMVYAADATSVRGIVRPNSAGSAQTFVVWGAQLEVGAAVTPYIQSPSVFVSRASSGTYIGGNGVLQTATTNLLLRSEEFTVSPWTLFGTASRAADVVLAPNGTQTADSVTLPVASGIYQSVSGSSGVTYTYSLWIRADSNQTVRLVINTNLNDPTAITVNVSTGWQRYSVTKTTSVGTTTIGGQLDTGAGATFYIWGAQLEQSSTVGEYIPTTSTINSAARYDHDPISLIGKGLLLEEARTNLLLRSEEFDNASWTKITATVTSNVATAPSGTVTADKLIVDNGQSAGYASQTISFVSGTLYTASCYAKAGEVSDFRFVFESGAFGSNLNAIFNLNTGVVSSFTAASASIQSAGNGWYRCVATALATATASAGVQFRSVHAGNGTNGILLWGAQLEAGAFATSYIPTTTATVTRAADVSTSVATSVFDSSWYSQSEGTVFADLVTTSRGYSAYPRLVGIFGSNIDASNEFAIYTRNIGTADDYKMYGIVTDGSVAGDFNPPASTPVGSGRVALSAKQNDGAFTVNGLTPVTDNTLNMPTSATQLLLFSNARYQPRTSGTIRRLTYWPQRLPNSTIQAITQ